MKTWTKVRNIAALVAIVLVGFMCASFSGSGRDRIKLVPDFRDAIMITGEIGGMSAVKAAELITKRAEDGEIKLVINSPGGDIFTGTAIISAMEIAKVRGARITCVVPFFAASMAMHIFAHCDNRFAIKNSFLLFHQGYAANIPKATEEDAERIRHGIMLLTRGLDEYLQKQLGIPYDEFMEYNRAQTLWPSAEFHKQFPAFTMLLVDDAIFPEGSGPFTF
jgi:ATP-dependent protease ClpP protease subunit